MELAENEKKLFLDAYQSYQESCVQVQEAKTNLIRASVEAKAQLSKVPLIPPKGIKSWDPEKALAAAEMLTGWGEAYSAVGRALIDQATALRTTATIATDLIEEAREAASG